MESGMIKTTPVDKGFGSTFQEGYQIWRQIPEENRKVQKLEHKEHNRPNEYSEWEGVSEVLHCWGQFNISELLNIEK